MFWGHFWSSRARLQACMSWRAFLEFWSASTSRDVLRELLSSVETLWKPESNGTLKCLFSVWNQGPGYYSPGPGTPCVDVAGHTEITWLYLLRLKVCATIYGLFWLFVMCVDSIKGQNKFIPCGDVQEAAVEGHPLATSDHPHPCPVRSSAPRHTPARPGLPSSLGSFWSSGAGLCLGAAWKNSCCSRNNTFFFFFWKELKGKDFVLFLASLWSDQESSFPQRW